jgi:phytanoyl-CoA hydroxylase
MNNHFEQYNNDGYISPAGYFDVTAISNLVKQHIIAHGDARSNGKTSFGHFKFFDPEMNPHHQSELIWDLVHGDVLYQQLVPLLGEAIVCLNTVFIAKPPRSGKYLAPHQDAVFWGLINTSACSVWIAITDSTPNNGCMLVYPGTHDVERRHHFIDDPNNILQMRERCETHDNSISPAVPLTLMQGQYSIHHCQIIHESKANLSDDWRIGLVARFANVNSLKEAYRASMNYSYVGSHRSPESNDGPQRPHGNFSTLDRISMLKQSRYTREYYKHLNNECIAKGRIE